MSCTQWEEAVARWVDGEAAAGVEEHIAGCTACRELAEALRADQALLRERAEVPDAAIAAVRARVREAVAPRGRSWWWVPAAAMAGVAAVWGVGAWRTLQVPMPDKLADPPALVVAKVDRWPRWVEPRKPAVAAPVVAARKVDVTPAQIHALRELFDAEERRARPARVAPSSEVAMQIVTSNPNVVIVWLKESKGEIQ